MLNITGMMMSGENAVDFLEMLPDNIPDEIKDEDFCDEYERMLNRVRAEVRWSVPVAPKVIKPISGRFIETYSCGQCGHDVKIHEKHCPECGRAIKWKAI